MLFERISRYRSDLRLSGTGFPCYADCELLQAVANLWLEQLRYPVCGPSAPLLYYRFISLHFDTRSSRTLWVSHTQVAHGSSPPAKRKPTSVCVSDRLYKNAGSSEIIKRDIRCVEIRPRCCDLRPSWPASYSVLGRLFHGPCTHTHTRRAGNSADP